MSHVVYKLFDATDTLLYIGVTHNWAERASGHRSASAWFGEVARVETEQFDSALRAYAREAALIAELSPRHNRRATMQQPRAILKGKQQSIRFGAEPRRLLALLAGKLGLNHTAIIELAIRALAEREEVK
jgi:predicted GIY-YIG superfamily endonuclease